MKDDICEIRCDALADMEEGFPLQVSVIREMLAGIDELCI
jgi:hypothetical protein